MKIKCPNPHCNPNPHIIKDGKFKRASDSRMIQRYKCQNCQKRFSQATFTLEKNQKKRRVNRKVLLLLSLGVSMRKIGRILKINQKTVARKAKYLALKYQVKNQDDFKRLAEFR